MADSERLRDSATHSVSDDAGAWNAKLVEKANHPFGVCADVDGMPEWPIAAPVAK